MLVALAGGLLAGCSQKRDVGDPCTVDVNKPGSTTDLVDACSVSGDWVETGVVGCENLVCILTPNPQGCDSALKNGVCSKPCVADSDCFPDETGLKCRSVILDPAFLNAAGDLLDKYLPPEMRLSSYCAFPFPSSP